MVQTESMVKMHPDSKMKKKYLQPEMCLSVGNIYIKQEICLNVRSLQHIFSGKEWMES